MHMYNMYMRMYMHMYMCMHMYMLHVRVGVWISHPAAWRWRPALGVRE